MDSACLERNKEKCQFQIMVGDKKYILKSKNELDKDKWV